MPVTPVRLVGSSSRVATATPPPKKPTPVPTRP
ncbi:hypothetical protein GMORB2_5261 [Geosmithia morbida]|uniref:Uncharacterized protein n=1 Tax=Geosmithia morbida TaxID=1094350 RepID=A0A9P5D6B7_9HYPO|nr:uncharacterized protein GMORB2_5261 [Geosmithia morbida]KAF4124595.1 hypothetical protein GMORB2_5261 [Geosmithia morbida]